MSFLPSSLLEIVPGNMGQITLNVTDIGNSGNAAIGLVGLNAAGLLATPDLTNWNNETDGITNWLTSNLFNTVGPVNLKMTIGAGATPGDYPIGVTLAGRDSLKWSTQASPPANLNFTVRVLMAGVPGDYNNNGAVDAADYVLWRNGGPLLNDPNPGNPTAQYNQWKANFGKPPGAGSLSFAIVPIPEPATVVLAVLGLLVIYIFPRGRH